MPGVSTASAPGGVRQGGRETMGAGEKEEHALGLCALLQVPLQFTTLFFHGTSV